jgi:hypothetical protein
MYTHSWQENMRVKIDKIKQGDFMNTVLRYTRISIVIVFTIALISLSISGCSQAVSPAALTTTAAAESPQGATAETIPVDIVNISDAHPGDDIEVTIKTKPGIEVNILFISPSGSKSAYPKDNTRVAGEDGTITWHWNINSHVPSGEATLTFTPTGGTPDSVVTVKKQI